MCTSLIQNFLFQAEDGIRCYDVTGVQTCALPISGEAPPRKRHDHIVFHTDGGHHIVFNDARRFGVMDLGRSDDLDRHPLLAELGIEPLGNEFNGECLAALFKGRRTPIKAALLDQRLIAGIGNIYACEILYAARLSPKRLAYTVVGARAERRSEEHTSELQSRRNLVCRLLLEKKKTTKTQTREQDETAPHAR